MQALPLGSAWGAHIITETIVQIPQNELAISYTKTVDQLADPACLLKLKRPIAYVGVNVSADISLIQSALI
jgi:hypothetical protein